MADERRDDLVSTTDGLETAGVFRSWKNFFFVISIICLCVLEICFWIVDTKNLVDPNSFPRATAEPNIMAKAEASPASGVIMLAAAATADQQADANSANAGQAAGPNTPAAKAPAVPSKPVYAVLHLRFEHLAWIIKVFNFVLILSVISYFLTILFSLKVSLVGRLGGMNHITRAMFLSLIALVLILPWQKYFGNVVTGWIFTPQQLINSKGYIEQYPTVFNIAIYYFRYGAWWVLLMLIMFFAQLRTIRWTKATMRRLGVM